MTAEMTEAQQLARAERWRIEREIAVDFYEALPFQGREAIANGVEEDLKREGWHHEDDCKPYCDHTDSDDGDEEDTAITMAQRIHAEMTAWHDKVHGISLLSSCGAEPCRSVSQQLLMVMGVPA